MEFCFGFESFRMIGVCLGFSLKSKFHNSFLKFVSILMILIPGCSFEDIFESGSKSDDISSIFTSDFQFVFIDPTTHESYNDALDLSTTYQTGMIDGMAITHKLAIHQHSRKKNILKGEHSKEDHPNHLNFLKEKVVTKKRRVKPPTVDYVDLNRTLSTPSSWAKDDYDEKEQGARNATTTTGISKSMKVQPEILVLFDYENTQRFNKNKTAIVDYLKVYFHGVNNRYGTISEPKISFRISGVMAVNSRKAQPYLEISELAQGGYDINKLLDNFASWTFKNFRNLPKHDIVHLITGETMKTKSSSGKYIDSISGLAYLKGACWVSSKLKKSMAVSIAQDIGGFWDGVFTSVHELAHNLGASHDGSKSSVKCPWTDGYIMSYVGWGTGNKFFFSRCSINSMTEFISSNEGSCVLRTQNAFSVSTYDAESTGEKLDMTMLCKRYTENKLAYVDSDTSPSDLCKNLVCRYPDGMDGYYLVKVNHPPGDNARCGFAGSSGRCMDGECTSA